MWRRRFCSPFHSFSPWYVLSGIGGGYSLSLSSGSQLRRSLCSSYVRSPNLKAHRAHLRTTQPACHRMSPVDRNHIHVGLSQVPIPHRSSPQIQQLPTLFRKPALLWYALPPLSPSPVRTRPCSQLRKLYIPRPNLKIQMESLFRRAYRAFSASLPP